ncbi:MAG: AAA family ATPase [Veillonella parvula]|uniref:AAA family ATPase n=1 Tax=Veillonella parvula TaxID=29466 RepID=A0A942WQK3_VEIPA|nr:AAA family ATPase [Veillonella parvula]MBS4893716.1 AAA family ATPase [Veillonella parvula]
MEEKIIKFDGSLNRVFFPKGKVSVSSGEFAIFSMNKVRDIEGCNIDYVKLKGIVPSLKQDVLYTITAKLAEQNSTYGDTYEVIFMNRRVDLSDKEKQKEFLKTIVSPTIVERLFDKYENVIDILETKNVEKLVEIKGVKTKTALKIIKIYDESKDYSVIFNELCGLNLTQKMIKRLVDHYKSAETVKDIIKKEPYRLIEIDGIAFKTADEIAKKVGMSKTSPKRIEACLIDVFKTEGEMGKSYLIKNDLLNNVSSTLSIEKELTEEVLNNLIEKRRVYTNKTGRFVGLMKYYNLEKRIYEELIRLINAESKVVANDWNKRVKLAEEKQGFKFNEDQMDAIKISTETNVFALTGISGAGKSAATKGICEVFKNYSIVGGALSGIAGMRLKEATELENAGTIHRMLGYQGEFTYTKNNPLDADVVIIDESTMVNLTIFLSVLEAIPDGAKVILLGDCEQIPPIGSGQVYADILQSGVIPSIKLLKPNRQSAKSGILEVARNVIVQNQLFKTTFEGVLIYGELEDMVVKVYKEKDISKHVIDSFMELYKSGEDIMDIQIISPMKQRGECCTYNLNSQIQKLLNPVNIQSDEFIINEIDKKNGKIYYMKVGDKVINKKNNYSAKLLEDGQITAVFNGSVGIIKEIDIKEEICVIDFVGIGEVIIEKGNWSDIELAYASTAHSTQGMTVKNAITVLESAAYMLLNSNLLYTAITRAKKKSILIGQNGAIRKAISNKESNNKLTYLDKFLRKVIE